MALHGHSAPTESTHRVKDSWGEREKYTSHPVMKKQKQKENSEVGKNMHYGDLSADP